MEEEKEYYENRNLKSHGFSNKGIKQGKWFFFFEEGKVFKEVPYLDGNIHGTLKRWYINGNLAIESEYKNGESWGLWKEYYENGRLKEEGNYMGRKFEVKNFWDSEGAQTMKDGTGYKIEKYGYLESDVYKQFFNDGVFIREEKIDSLNITGFEFPED